jgi:hypothetical protein
MLTKSQLDPKISAQGLEFFGSYSANLAQLNLQLNQIDVLLNKFATTQITSLPLVDSQIQNFLSCYLNLKRLKKVFKHNILAHQHRYSKNSSILKLKTTIFEKKKNEEKLAVFLFELNSVSDFLQTKIVLSKTKKDIFYFTSFLKEITPVLNIIKQFNSTNQ